MENTHPQDCARDSLALGAESRLQGPGRDGNPDTEPSAQLEAATAYSPGAFNAK